MYKIVQVPDSILSTRLKPVTAFDDKLKEIVKQMTETLIAQQDPPGVGLAANQVGLNLAVFILKKSLKSPVKVFINPRILKLEAVKTKKKGKKTKEKTKLEGCLSVNNIWSPVKRTGKVLLEYQTVTGEKKTGRFSGFESVIIQHEADHLEGVLFTQRALEQNIPLYEEVDGELKKVKI